MLGHRTLELADYQAIFKRRRWLILSCVLIFPAIGAAITHFIPPRYTSQTLVLIEQQRISSEYVKPVDDSGLDARLSSMKEQILSRSRVQPIVERYNLFATGHNNMDERVAQAQKAIAIKPIHSTISNSGGLPGFFITFTASDAHTAQLVCGEITTLFLNENLRAHEAAAEGTTDFLKGQLEDAKRALDDQDKKLADFQRKNVYQQPGAENGNVQMLTSLNAQFEASTQQLAQMEQAKTYAQSQLAQDLQIQQQTRDAQKAANPGVAIGSTDPVYQQQQRDLQTLQTRESELLTQYTPDHPDVVAVRRQIAELKKQMVAPAAQARAADAPPLPDSPAVLQLRSQIRAADIGIQEKRREQAAIQSNLAMYQARISASPEVEQEYKQLTRDYEVSQHSYDVLLSKMNQAKEATDLERRQQGEAFRVMDEPNLPDTPSFPVVPQFIAGGLLLGLAIAGAIGGFLEYRDTALRSERDVWAFTHLPTLGMISISGEMPEDKPHLPSLLSRLFKRQHTLKHDGNLGTPVDSHV
jgi:polysaccharide chain length determinant protein (PEP-CTERM system associated)